MDLIDAVRTTIERYDMLQPQDRVIVAVSGGADSLALLHLLLRLREEYDLVLHVAHLNHGLRPEAAAEAEFVREIAREWGVPATVEEFDVAAAAQKQQGSRQEIAREARYRFFARIADGVGADRIALGHQRDDQVETVLLRMLRGAGLRGLGGIRPVRGPIIRPLIDCFRAEIEAYCRVFGLQPVQDPSNASPAYFRNRIRLNLIPLLESEYNPRFREAVARLAAIVQEDEALLDAQARRHYGHVAWEVFTGRGRSPDGPGREVRLHVVPFRRLPRAMQRRVVRRALARAGGDLRRAEFEHVETLIEFAEGADAGSELDLPGGMRARMGHGFMALRRDGAGPQPAVVPVEHELAVPGVTAVPELGVTVTVRVIEQEADEPIELAAYLPEGDEDTDELCAFMDLDRLRPPLVVRNRQAGDRMAPLGLGGSKKVQDILVDEKVPRAERDRVPIIADTEGILWVVGLRLDERVRVHDGTRRMLLIQVTRG